MASATLRTHLITHFPVLSNTFQCDIYWGSRHTKPAWPVPAPKKNSPSSPLPDGTEGCGRGGGMALNLWRFPKNSLTYCHATADLSNKHPGKGEKQGRVPSPSLSHHNLERPDWICCSFPEHILSRLVSELVLRGPDCENLVLCVPVSLCLGAEGNLGQNVKQCVVFFSWCSPHCSSWNKRIVTWFNIKYVNIISSVSL